MADDYRPAQADAKSQQKSEAVDTRLQDQTQLIVTALHEVVGWLQGKTTKTEVVNQLTSIKTPDVDKVVAAVEQLDRTVGRQTFDTSDLVQALQSVKLDTVEVTNLSELDKRLGAIEKAVKGIKF